MTNIMRSIEKENDLDKTTKKFLKKDNKDIEPYVMGSPTYKSIQKPSVSESEDEV